MINNIATYRRLFASLLALWMSLIVISGIVFMHKEVTSNGEIITHIHPYDFTKKKDKSHHKNDAEIRYLDVVFQGSFLEPQFYNLDISVPTEFEINSYFCYFQTYLFETIIHSFTRGPPALFNS